MGQAVGQRRRVLVSGLARPSWRGAGATPMPKKDLGQNLVARSSQRSACQCLLGWKERYGLGFRALSE